MPKPALLAALAVVVLLGFGFLGLSYRNQGLELETLAAELAAAQAAGETNLTEQASLRTALEASRAQADRLQREKDSVARNQKSLEEEMRRTLASKDITISELQGKLTVNILDRILFDSGEATLKPEGHEVLFKIAEVLAQYPARQVHVIGHTDNVPIRASARDRFPSNWELSTARATAAVRFLVESANVDPRRLGAVGYGEFHPLADNATAEGRAKNRRIAVVVLSEELAGSDVVPKAGSAPPSASTPEPAAARTNLLRATTNAPPGTVPTNAVSPRTNSPSAGSPTSPTPTP